MTEAGSPSETWKDINGLFTPQTPGRKVGLFSGLVNASIPPEGNPQNLYARLTIIFHQMPTNIENPGVVQYIRNNLVKMKKFLSASKSFEAEVRALRTNASKGTLVCAHVKRLTSDRFQHWREPKRGPGSSSRKWRTSLNHPRFFCSWTRSMKGKQTFEESTRKSREFK